MALLCFRSFEPRLDQGVHQFCCSVGQTWKFSKCLWFTTDCLLVCEVFRIAGPLTNWTHCLRRGGKQQTQAEGLREGGIYGSFHTAYINNILCSKFYFVSMKVITFTHCGKLAGICYRWPLCLLRPKIYTLGTWDPLSLLLVVWGKLLLPELQDRADPLGQTVPSLLTPPRQ